MFCAADDLLPKRPGNARRTITDAEVVTLAVAQAMLGISSDRQFLRCARCQLAGLFPLVPTQDAFDVLLVLHAHNDGAKPLTIERMGVLSLDRLHHGHDLAPRQRVMEASWTKRLPQPTPLERGRGGAEIRFSVEELAHHGLSFEGTCSPASRCPRMGACGSTASAIVFY